MNRFLHWFNLLGVLALAALCVLQWRANRQLNLEVNRREHLRLEQAATLEEHAKTAVGQTSDLAALQSHVVRLTDELKQTAAQLAAAERALCQSAAEREQLKSSVTNWAAAVAARDERLKQTASRLTTMADERNEVTKRFNELAERHNQLVKDFDEAQRRLGNALTNATPVLRQP